MERMKLSDGSGRWFDAEKAEKFEEDTWFNGHNHVSVATGDQFTHEVLYKTAKGLWVLHEWSQWQGSRATYIDIEPARAQDWLLYNGHDDAVPQRVISNLEV